MTAKSTDNDRGDTKVIIGVITGGVAGVIIGDVTGDDLAALEPLDRTMTLARPSLPGCFGQRRRCANRFALAGVIPRASARSA